MKTKRKPKSLQELLVEVLDKRIPITHIPNRRRISRREAVLRKVIELAGEGETFAFDAVERLYDGNFQTEMDERLDERMPGGLSPQFLAKMAEFRAKKAERDSDDHAGYDDE